MTLQSNINISRAPPFFTVRYLSVLSGATLISFNDPAEDALFRRRHTEKQGFPAAPIHSRLVGSERSCKLTVEDVNLNP